MGGALQPATQAEMLRKHEKALSKLQLQPSAKQQPGVPMTPSSVLGTGAAVGAPGVVTLTNASGNIDIDGIFSAAFEDYLLYLDLFSSTASTPIVAQFRNAAGLYTNATGYRYGQFNLPYATATNYVAPAQGASLGYFGSSSGAGGGSSEIKVFSAARPGTEIKILGEGLSSGGRTSFWGWVNSGIGAATGIRIAPSSGSITGALRIYGINPV